MAKRYRPKLRVLLADGRPICGARLAEHFGADTAFDLIAVATTLMEAYNSAEVLGPDAVAISAEMVERPEFGMFGALLKALGRHAVVYGENRPANMRARRSGAGPEFLPLGPDLTPAVLAQALAQAAQRFAPAPGAAEALPVVAIGASTGGVEALQSVFAAYPETCPPTVIVQLIRGDVIPSIAARLDAGCAATVREARHGDALQPGMIYIAPGNATHLTLSRARRPDCRPTKGPTVAGHRPSVDVLFRSVAPHAPAVIGVLLTGMGSDEAAGLLEMRTGGGFTIAQDAATSTVYGMPRVALESGTVDLELLLPQIGTAIIEAFHCATSPDRKRMLS